MPSFAALTSLASHPIDSTFLLLRVGLSIPSVVTNHVLASLENMGDAQPRTPSPRESSALPLPKDALPTAVGRNEKQYNEASSRHCLAFDDQYITYRRPEFNDTPASARLPSRTLPSADRRSVSTAPHARTYTHVRSASDSMRSNPLILGRLPSTPVITALRNADLESVDTSHELAQPPVTSTPYRPLQTSADTSLASDISLIAGSHDSTYEIYLGPQPPSFIHRRRMQALDSPIRHTQLPNVLRLVPMTIRPDTSEWAGEPVVPPDPVVRPRHLSRWRQEQIKRMKPPRPVAGARERPIPTLHGPLSLPYARNPSGADAIVADQSAYMSHVFGLRTMPSPAANKVAPPPPANSRVPSGSSNADSTTRVVSGSSTGSNPAANKSGSTEASFISAGGTYHNRPVVVRDPNQVIGLRKHAEENAKNKLTREEAALAVQRLASSRPTHVEVVRSPDARAYLGVATPRAVLPVLSPIPGSPSDNVKGRSVDDAIHSHLAGAGTWHIPPVLFNAVASMPMRATAEEARAHLKTATSVASAAPSATSSTTNRNTSGSSGEWATIVSRKPDATHVRSRPINPMKHLVKLHPSPAAPRAPASSAASSPIKHGDRVLTLDGLFEKFGSATDQAHTGTVLVKKAGHASKRKSDPPVPETEHVQIPSASTITVKHMRPRTPSGRTATTNPSPGPLGETPINTPAREEGSPFETKKDNEKGKQTKPRSASNVRAASDVTRAPTAMSTPKSTKSSRVPSKVVAKPHSSPKLDTTEATAAKPTSSVARPAAVGAHRAKGTPGAGKLLKRSAKPVTAARASTDA